MIRQFDNIFLFYLLSTTRIFTYDGGSWDGTAAMGEGSRHIKISVN